MAKVETNDGTLPTTLSEEKIQEVQRFPIHTLLKLGCLFNIFRGVVTTITNKALQGCLINTLVTLS